MRKNAHNIALAALSCSPCRQTCTASTPSCSVSLAFHANPSKPIAPPTKHAWRSLAGSELSFTPPSQLTPSPLAPVFKQTAVQRDIMWTMISEVRYSSRPGCASLDHSRVHHLANVQICVTRPRPVRFRHHGQHTLSTLFGHAGPETWEPCVDTLLYSVPSHRSGPILTREGVRVTVGRT